MKTKTAGSEPAKRKLPQIVENPDGSKTLVGVSISELDTPIYVSPEWNLSVRLHRIIGKHRLLVAARSFTSVHAVSCDHKPEEWGGWCGARFKGIKARRVILARKPFRFLPERFQVEGESGFFKAERIALGGPRSVGIWAIIKVEVDDEAK